MLRNFNNEAVLNDVSGIGSKLNRFYSELGMVFHTFNPWGTLTPNGHSVPFYLEEYHYAKLVSKQTGNHVFRITT